MKLTKTSNHTSLATRAPVASSRIMPRPFQASPANEHADAGKNLTGLPDQLKTGIENLSGWSLDDVRVHYNSDKPAQLQAYAYAQGTDIHLAPGQEKHLPHEAWHVVQQKQGRVKPTMQLTGGQNANDDSRLEWEAEVMGERAVQMKAHDPGFLTQISQPSFVVQRMVINLDPDDETINRSVPKIARRKFTKDKFQAVELGPEEEAQAKDEMQEIIDAHPKTHHNIMSRADASFVGLEDSDEPIIFVGHGTFTGEFDKALGGLGYLMRLFKPQIAMSAKFWNAFSGQQLGTFLIKRGLPKSYRGQIYVDGCNTATGPEVGAPKAFIDELIEYLQIRGYEYLSVKGNLGWATTRDDGSEENESPLIKSKLDNTVSKMMNLEPKVKVKKLKNRDGYEDSWQIPKVLFEMKLDVEKKPEDAKLKRDIQRYEEYIDRQFPGGFKNGWTDQHTAIYTEFKELNENANIVDFVRVRAPLKIKK